MSHKMFTHFHVDWPCAYFALLEVKLILYEIMCDIDTDWHRKSGCLNMNRTNKWYILRVTDLVFDLSDLNWFEAFDVSMSQWSWIRLSKGMVLGSEICVLWPLFHESTLTSRSETPHGGSRAALQSEPFDSDTKYIHIILYIYTLWLWLT